MNILAAVVGTFTWLLLYIVWAQYAPWGGAWLHLGGYTCIGWITAAVLVVVCDAHADVDSRGSGDRPPTLHL